MLKSDFDALAAGGINALDPEAFKRIDEFGLKNPKFRSAIEKVATGRVNDLSDDEYYGIIDKIGAPERAAKLRKEAEVYAEEARQRIEENERGPIEGFVKGMAQDITVPLASGVVGLGKSAADLAYLLPIGNKPRTLVGDVKQGLKSAQDWVEDQRSFLRKDEIAQSAADMEAARRKAEAEGGSVIAAEVAQSLRNIKRDPAALAEGVLKQAPNIAALMLGGGAAGMAAKGAGATLSGVGKAQTAGAILSGAGLSAADVGGGVTDDVLALPDATFDAFPEFTKRVSELTAKGLPEDRARQRAKEEIAVSRGRVGALVGGGLALGTAAAGKFIPGVNTIEKAIGRNLAPTAGVGRLSQVATGVLGEGVGEAIEEGAGAAAQNLLVGGVDPTRSATRGIGEAAVQGALTAGPTAAVFGASGGEFDEAAIADKNAAINRGRETLRAFNEAQSNLEPNIRADVERKVQLIREGKIPFKIEDFEKAITRLGLDPAQIETFGSLEQKKQAYLSAAEAELERLKQQEAETGVSATEEPLGIEWDGTIKVPPTERTPTQTWAGRSAPTFQPPSAEELVSEIAKTNPSAAKVAAANRASQDGYFDELTNARPEMIERVTSWRKENPFGQYSDFITQLENEVVESDPAVQKADQQAKKSRAKAASVKVATQTADPTQAPPPGVTPEEMRKAMQDGGASIEAEATADQEHARTVRQTKAKQAEEVKAAKLVEKQKKLEAKQKVMAGMIRLKTGEEVDVDALLEEASVAGIRDSAEANIASIRKKLEEKARKESEKVAKASAKKAKTEATQQPTTVEEPQTQPAPTQEAPAQATPTQVEPVAEPTQVKAVQAQPEQVGELAQAPQITGVPQEVQQDAPVETQPEAQPEQPIDYTPFIEEMSKASLKSIANTDTERITAELSRLGKVEHGIKANPPNRARAQVLSRLSALAGAVLPRTYNTYAPSAISAILSFGGFSASNPLTYEDQVVELGRKLEQLSTFTPPKESFTPSPELLRDGRKFKPTSIDRAGDRVALTFGDFSGSVDASTFDDLDAPDAVRTVITDGSSAVLKIANPEGTRYLEVSDIKKTATDEGTPVVDPADVEDPAVSKELKSIYSTIDQLIDEDFENFTSEATAFYSSLSGKAFNLPEAYAKAATRLSKARDQISDLMDAVSISEQEGEIDPQILKDLKKMQKQIPAIQRDTALLSTVTGIFSADKAKMENYPDPDSELHKASGMRVGLLAKQMYPNSFLPPETLSVLAAKAYSEAMGASPLENPGEFNQWMQEQVKSVKLSANHPTFFIAGAAFVGAVAAPAITSAMLTASAITYAGLQLAKLASRKLGRFGNSERWFIGSTDVDYTDPNTQKTTTIKGKDVLSTLDQAKYLRSEHARQPNLFFRMANKRYGVELLKQAGRVGEHMARTALGMKGVNRVDSPIYKMNKQIADFLEGKSSSISPELRRIADDLRSITNHFHGMMQARGIRGLDPSKYYPKAYDSESMRKLMSDKVAYNDYLKSDLIPKVIRTMKDAVNEETRRLAAQAAAQKQVVNIQNLFQAAAENIAKEITSSMSGLSGGSSGDKATLHTSRHLKERSVPFDVPDTWRLSSGEIVPLRDYDVRRLFSRYIASMARTMAEMDVVDKEMIRRYTNGIPQQAINDTQSKEIAKSVATIINNDLMDSTGSVIAHEGTRKASAVARQVASTLFLAFNPYFVLIRNLALALPNLYGMVGLRNGTKAIGSMLGALVGFGREEAHKKGKIRDIYHPYGMQDGAGFLADLGFRAANLGSVWGQSAIDIAGYNAGYNYAPKLVKQARDEVAGKKTFLVDITGSRGKMFGEFDEAREMLREAFSEEEAAQIETGKALTEFQRERIATFIRDKISVDSRNLNIPAWLGNDLSRTLFQFMATASAGLGTTMKTIENPKRAFNLAIGMGTAWTTAVLLQYLLASLLGDEDKEEKFGELVEKMGGSASDGLELGMDMAARTGVFGPLNILPDALKATYAEEPVQLRTILTSGAPSFQIAQSLIDMGVSAGKLTRDDYEVQDLRDDLPTQLQKLGEGGNLIGGFVEE